ncbi:hypothetical protein C1645_469271 [Glomus cerebriforme]|uniref:Uncharacterized protein n=1 Tax=Glomus cerebriforme TaxID=658196 RepID=A0A397SEH6_9GLOM|nr:hypothetical protein C1645_469271 [Glomus cerebriforme]
MVSQFLVQYWKVGTNSSSSLVQNGKGNDSLSSSVWNGKRNGSPSFSVQNGKENGSPSSLVQNGKENDSLCFQFDTRIRNVLFAFRLTLFQFGHLELENDSWISFQN